MQEMTEKINNEIRTNEKNINIKSIGEYVISLLPKLDQQTIDAMKSEGKTIKGSIDAMKKEARKVAVGGMGMLTDEEGFKIVREYFGIKEEQASGQKIIDLNAYL